MPLSKQAKALYEAALRRKGLPLDKMPIEHVTPDTYGPFRVQRWWKDQRPFPMDTYWQNRGRYQDLEDEMAAAIDAGRYERKSPFAYQYYRYYNDGDFPTGAAKRMPNNRYFSDRYEYGMMDYDDPAAYTYDKDIYRTRGGRKKYAGTKKELTRLGQMELDAITDADVVNDYKNYLRQMYSGKIKQRPPKYGVRVWDRMTHEPLVSEYDDIDNALKGLRRNRDDYGSAYLEEIWPE